MCQVVGEVLFHCATILGIARHVRKAVEQAPVSRYVIHKATGIDQAVLSKFVRGERTGLSMETVDALCDYLGLKLVPEKKPEKNGR